MIQINIHQRLCPEIASGERASTRLALKRSDSDLELKSGYFIDPGGNCLYYDCTDTQKHKDTTI